MDRRDYRREKRLDVEAGGPRKYCLVRVCWSSGGISSQLCDSSVRNAKSATVRYFYHGIGEHYKSRFSSRRATC